MEILEILEDIEESIEKSFSLLGMTIVNKSDMLAMLEELRMKLPDEIKQAKWVKEERQKILAEAQTEANSIVEGAKEKVIALVDEHEIAKQAKARAEQLIADAKAQESEMRKNAILYADSMLEKVENVTAGVLDKARESRRQLK
ncbi:MAG: ATPase [Ruminococcaceae bacterium]|jgi:cell division septum initiation protein DivIVA|nr:ATPase [Oscillospiraceae bacterium]